VIGEADLFPRSADGRVVLSEADRMEIGYFLDAAVTGQGLATEAARALLEVASAMPGISHVEIRCDAANAPSAAVPQRLGFSLDSIDGSTQVWSIATRDGVRNPRS
jgi:RimJ/RimL family protein N-acetyltransferase